LCLEQFTKKRTEFALRYGEDNVPTLDHYKKMYAPTDKDIEEGKRVVTPLPKRPGALKRKEVPAP
jgi:hypothetical protein